MRLYRALAAGALAAAPASLFALGAGPAVAHQSPPGCNSNSLVLLVTKEKTLVRNGDRTSYTVSASNDDGLACDLTDERVTLTLPARDGTPTGRTVTLASNVDFPAGMPMRELGTVPYTVDVEPGVEDAVVEASANGTLHDAPVDHAARITKTLGTTVTQPHATLTKVATPTSGQAPLTVTYDYTLTNDSSTNAPIANATVTDDKCAPVVYTGGDSNANSLLDVGERFTFRCTQTFTSGGVFVNTATATGTNTVDNRPVPIAPAQASVTVTEPPRPEAPVNVERPVGSTPPAGSPAPGQPATSQQPGTPAQSLPPVAGQRTTNPRTTNPRTTTPRTTNPRTTTPGTTRTNRPAEVLPPVLGERSRSTADAKCVYLPKKVTVRAGELTTIRVRVRDDNPEGALVRITGPGVNKRGTADADGNVVFRVRPTRSGTLTIQSSRCAGADRVSVLAQRRVSSGQVPRVTG